MRWTPLATVVGDRDEGAVREHDPLGEAAGRRRRAECQARHTARKRARSAGKGRRAMTRPSRSDGRSDHGAIIDFPAIAKLDYEIKRSDRSAPEPGNLVKTEIYI